MISYTNYLSILLFKRHVNAYYLYPNMNKTLIYALDFDGVICDSAVETAMTGWKAACTLWPDMPKTIQPDMIERFRVLRPIIETGYEAILVMRLLYLNESIEAVYSSYSDKIKTLLEEAQVSVNDLKKLFGKTRDQWIADDLADWINMNPLFAGVAEKLQQLGQHNTWYIITTKQERFVKHILKAYAIELADERIFGLDRNMSKIDVLKALLHSHNTETLYFVEDRLPTLINVLSTKTLSRVKLIFALWGYNTAEDKALAARQPFILQQLEDFLA
jgi:phosphoglycolate phosphatase-like HAD superfamily hydrolase